LIPHPRPLSLEERLSRGKPITATKVIATITVERALISGVTPRRAVL
jgi:hypothetical protein